MANYNRSGGYCYVAERFAAHNLGSYKRSQGKYRSLSFMGDTAYSYSTAIARWHTDKQGKKVLLLQEHDYSMTTKGHKQVLRSHKYDYIEVPCIGVDWRVGEPIDHNKNLAFMWGKVTELQAKAIRLWNKDQYNWHIYGWPDRIAEWLRKMVTYQRRFGGDLMQVCDFPNTDDFIARIHVARDQKRAVFEDPRAVERRARAKARRLMKLALNLES